MRWISVAFLLLCVAPVAAQSLGDVARQQRDNPNRPKAKHVITNNDLGSSSYVQPSPAEPSTQPITRPANPANRSQSMDAERALLQRRVAEVNQRVQVLQNELNDLEKHRVSLRSGAIYGDPNRTQKNDEMKALGEQIESKTGELTAARNELTDAIDRANHTSVLK
jgi:septal ring factor EnvC (AmiA/AmiB activator)